MKKVNLIWLAYSAGFLCPPVIFELLYRLPEKGIYFDLWMLPIGPLISATIIKTSQESNKRKILDSSL